MKYHHRRRCRIPGYACSITGVAVVALVAAGALSADSIVDNATFSTTNQSMWQTGAAGSSPPTEQECFCITWGSESARTPFPIPVPPAGAISFNASVNPGNIGLLLQDQLTSGAVSVNYPVQLTYRAPNLAAAGSLVSISTSAVPDGTPLLNTFGPGFSASLSLTADINANVDLKYSPLVGSPIVVPTHISTDGQKSITLVSIGSGSTGRTFKLPLPGFSIGVQLPNPLNLQTSQLFNGNQLQVNGTASPPFVSLNLEMADLVTAALRATGVPFPDLNGKTGIDSLGTQASYTILSDLIQMGPKFAQGFTFTAESIPVVLVANTGQVERGVLGQTFQFKMPKSGKLVVTATADLAAMLQNQTGLALGANQTLSLLSGSLTVAGFDLYNFGPLYTDTQNFG